MRSPSNDKTDGVKRFSYKKPNGESSDDNFSYQTSWNSTQQNYATPPMLGNSDMDVIWSVKKDSTSFMDKLTAVSPPPAKGFYSRHTSQDPRFRSQLGGAGRRDLGKPQGPASYSFGQSKSKYSYSQGQAGHSRFQDSDAFHQPNNKPTMQKGSHQSEYQDGMQELNRSCPGGDGRHSSSSWDDF